MKKLLVFASLFLLLFYSCGENGEKEFIDQSGTVETTDIIISSQVSGTILSLIKDEGSSISKGDTILIIDPENYLLQLQQAEAQ